MLIYANTSYKREGHDHRQTNQELKSIQVWSRDFAKGHEVNPNSQHNHATTSVFATNN